MEDRLKSFPKFQDLVKEAGLRSLIWSPLSYYAGRFYHWIVAVFTALIMLAAFAKRLPWQFAMAIVVAYGVYFAVRKRLSPSWERRFYRVNVQFIRAQLTILVITLLLRIVPHAEQIYMWLLFVPVILLTSKNCKTWHFAVVVIEVWIILLALRWLNGGILWPPFEFLVNNTDLISEWLWIGLLSFILHYLIRNIQARSETIASYNAVNVLAAQVDMTDAVSSRQWQPLLSTLVYLLDGECAATWLYDTKTQSLRCVASIVLTESTPVETLSSKPELEQLVPLNSPMLIARVARAGQPDQTDQPDAMTARLLWPLAAVEFAVPIEVGAGEERSIVGVLSVGFKPKAFKPRLKQDYAAFLQGLVNQAKPMLAYAQRLDEIVALQNLSRAASHSLDLEAVLNAVLRAVVETLGFEFALISLVDEDRQVIKAACGLNVPAEWLVMAEHPLTSKDIQAYVVRTGETVVLSDWDDRFDKAIWAQFNHQDMVRVFTPVAVGDPITGVEHIIGTIEAGHHRGQRGVIAEHQLRMLDTFKNQAAIAIEHAQLLERTRHKAEVLTSLHEVGQSIALARDLATLLNEIGRQARVLLQADVVMLYRYHADTNKVEPPLIFGEVGSHFKPVLNMDHTNLLTHLLRETQAPHYRPDAAQNELPIRDWPGPGERSRKTFVQMHNIRSFAGIPLVVNGETVGAMFVNYRTRHQFDADERQIHELFAQQAAAAINQAESNELARELIIRDERDHLARELHHSVSQALFGIGVKSQIVIDALGDQSNAVQLEALKIAEIVQAASNEIGFLINELRAPIDESRHLVAGLEEYARRLNRWYSANVQLEIKACPLLSPTVEQTLLRLAREALNNSVRHAHSRTITVRLDSDERRLTLVIHDDGRGFDQTRVPPGKWGLKNMNELASQVNAKLAIDAVLERGTTITLEIELQPEEVRR